MAIDGYVPRGKVALGIKCGVLWNCKLARVKEAKEPNRKAAQSMRMSGDIDWLFQ